MDKYINYCEFELYFSSLTDVSLVHNVCSFSSVLKRRLCNERTCIFQRGQIFLCKEKKRKEKKTLIACNVARVIKTVDVIRLLQ